MERWLKYLNLYNENQSSGGGGGGGGGENQINNVLQSLKIRRWFNIWAAIMMYTRNLITLILKEKELIPR